MSSSRMLSVCISSRAARERLCQGLRPPILGLGHSSRLYASNYKKRNTTTENPLGKKSDLFNTKSTQDPVSSSGPLPLKIVQVRTTSSKTEPPKDKPEPTKSFTSSSNYQGGSIPPPGPNYLKRILAGLFVATASLAGVYYSGFLDSFEPAKKEIKVLSPKKSKKTRPINRYPLSREDFPAKIPYVLVGGGTASFAAFRAIKSRDPTAKVLVISAEDSIPYMRPPLSKEIWQQKGLETADKLTFKQWNGQERSLYYEPLDFYTKIDELESSPKGGVVIATGWNVKRVDALSNTVYVTDPSSNSEFPIEYQKCLIATGSKPKNLPVFEKVWDSVSSRTILYRNIRDLENLWGQIENAKSIAIVGGGFLGSELACSLGSRFKNESDRKVIQIFKEPGNMGRVLPEYLSKWTTDKVIEEGVNVISNTEVRGVQLVNNKVLLSLSNDDIVKADVVVVAVGSEPCTDLAETSRLEVDPQNGGFLVNAELEARSNLYAAGDAACFYDPVLGRRRVEHHDHAVVSGRLAGENMVGAAKPYKHQSMFWSDLGPDVGYEAIGIIDASLPTVSVFAKDLEPKKESEQEEAVKNNKSAEYENSDVNKNLDKPIQLNESAEKVDKKENESSEKADKQESESDAKENYNKGIVFYLRNETVVGIVLWNVFSRMHIARQVLSQQAKYEDLNELAKLFKLHED